VRTFALIIQKMGTQYQFPIFLNYVDALKKNDLWLFEGAQPLAGVFDQRLPFIRLGFDVQKFLVECLGRGGISRAFLRPADIVIE